MDDRTFGYVKPTDAQIGDLAEARAAFHACCTCVDRVLPEGVDKTVVIRMIRTAAMWASVAITRLENGAPRA